MRHSRTSRERLTRQMVHIEPDFLTDCNAVISRLKIELCITSKILLGHHQWTVGWIYGWFKKNWHVSDVQYCEDAVKVRHFINVFISVLELNVKKR